MSYNYGLLPSTTQKVQFTASSVATANAVSDQCEYVRLAATKACHVKMSTSTAQTTAKVNGAVSSSTTINIDTVVEGLAPIAVGQVVTGTGISGVVTVVSIVSASVITVSGNVSIDNNVDVTFSDKAAVAATTSDMYLPENEIEIVKVSPNSKVAAIRNTSTSGDLFVTEMSS